MHSSMLSRSILLSFSTTTLFLALVESSSSSSSLATCYFPDQTIAKNYVACSPTQNGGCCQESDICTEWGYCVSQSRGYHYRGACTDDTWRNPSCPDYCLGSASSNTSFVNVIACDPTDSGGTWCCAYDGNCCSGSSNFVPSFGTMFAEPGGSLTSSAAGSSSTSVSANTTSSISSTSSTSSISSTSTSSTSSTSVTAATSSQASSNSGPLSSTTSIIVGTAVGLPLGLATLAALFLFCRERQKRKHTEANEFDKKADDDIVSPVNAEIKPSNDQPAGGYYAPAKSMNLYEEMDVKHPYYELGEGKNPIERGIKEIE